MKAVSLCFHDAVAGSDFDAVGFRGSAAASYKLAVADMERHFDAIAAARLEGPATVDRFFAGGSRSGCPLFLTFDDGGASAATHIADLLERRGWRGHFFITAARVDTPGFVTRAQVRRLRRAGHVVGSHSWSHPTRMALCEWDELHREWTRSIAFLSELLGERVTSASVPGGYYSPRVASAAAAAGIDVLFTSEPHKRIVQVDGCHVLGRYWLLRGMPASASADLAAPALSRLQLRQLLAWNGKKVLKRVGGKGYLAVRERVLRRRHSA